VSDEQQRKRRIHRGVERMKSRMAEGGSPREGIERRRRTSVRRMRRAKGES
jgi:hypothetical protein